MVKPAFRRLQGAYYSPPPPPPLNQAFFAKNLLQNVIPVTQKAFFWQKKGIWAEIGSKAGSQREGLGSIELLAQAVRATCQTGTEAVRGQEKAASRRLGQHPPPARWRADARRLPTPPHGGSDADAPMTGQRVPVRDGKPPGQMKSPAVKVPSGSISAMAMSVPAAKSPFPSTSTSTQVTVMLLPLMAATLSSSR